jgi:hypothetical protein
MADLPRLGIRPDHREPSEGSEGERGALRKAYRAGMVDLPALDKMPELHCWTSN